MIPSRGGAECGRIGYSGPSTFTQQITGTADLTGFSQFLFDPADPLRAGYLFEV